MPLHLKSEDRIIVALDVPTHDEALALVGKLDNVSFFKVGLHLLLAGDLYGLLRRLRKERGNEGKVFIDLKIAGDISNTVANFVHGANSLGIRFITFAEAAEPAITRHTLAAGRTTRSDSPFPKFLMVPLLSSLAAPETGRDPDTYIVDRGKAMVDAGCDGLVVSGTSIGACRNTFPETILVAPGIRPVWSGPDDHARWTTPADAIEQGADYLVVGRPVLQHMSPREAAQRIIEEIEDASVRR